MVKSFILRNVDKIDKISCHSYDPDVLNMIKKIDSCSSSYELNKLSTKIKYGDGKWELRTTDYVPENFQNAVKLLQISNISEDGEIIPANNDKYISKELHEKWKGSKIEKGNIIIAITGTIGRMAIFNEIFEANLNQALGVIKLKKEHEGIKIIPEYIHLYLNSNFSIQQLLRFGGYRSGQAGLSLDEIGSVKIVLPDEKVQLQIINKVKKIRVEALSHYKDYIKYANMSKNLPVELLGIELPNETENIFVLKKEFDGSQRIDAINNAPFLKKLKSNLSKKEYKKFSEVLRNANNKFEFNDFYKLVDLDNIDENISQIKSFVEVKTLNSQKTLFKMGNLLVSKLGSEKGNIILIDKEHDGFLGSGELMPFELNDGSTVSIEYLYYLLRSPYLSKQIEYTLSGCSRMRISQKDIQNLIFPIQPDKDQIIVSRCKNLIDKSVEEKSKYISKRKEMNDDFEREVNKII